MKPASEQTGEVATAIAAATPAEPEAQRPPKAPRRSRRLRRALLARRVAEVNARLDAQQEDR